MAKQRTLKRLITGLLVAGTMAVGALAPAEAAGGHDNHPVRMEPGDTGWNGT